METDVRGSKDILLSNISIRSTAVERETFGRIVGVLISYCSYPISFLLDLLRLPFNTERRLCSRYTPLRKGGPLVKKIVRTETNSKSKLKAIL